MFFLNVYMLLLFSKFIVCEFQVGPDPWEVNDKLNQIPSDVDIPPDLRFLPEKKTNVRNGVGVTDLFYKRMLAIVLKAGQVKEKEDGTVDVSLHMQFEKERWLLLERYTALNFVLTEDMIRRSLGYIEESINKPTIVEKAAIVWTEYIQLYLVEYKMYITWTFGALGFLAAAIWLWNHMSHVHIYIVLFISLYLYEVFTSYKEAEKEDLKRFLSAVNNCKWYFWSSNCDVPPPDPLTFIKYMNPLKIGIRMFTTVITEPMICINEAVEVLLHGITDGMWFPLNTIVYGILTITFNIFFIFFLIMIVFNYILNIPFTFSFLGLLNIGLMQRNRAFNIKDPEPPVTANCDRISGDTLNRLLDVCSRALNTAGTTQNRQNTNNTMLSLTSTSNFRMRRSASTGRLPSTHDNISDFQYKNSRKLIKNSRNFNKKSMFNGDGDRF